MEKIFEHIQEAERELKTIDHLVYVTFPLIKDKRLLLKVLQELKGVITHCITAILQYEYLYKRINLYQDSKENFKTFAEKCSSRYDINQNDIRLIFELFDFVEKHKQSPFEFIKDGKVVILSESSKPTTLTIEKTKEFLILSKEIIKKTREGMKKNV